MFCSKCGAEITNTSASFCAKCGVPVKSADSSKAPPSASAASALPASAPDAAAPRAKKTGLSLLIIALILILAITGGAVWYITRDAKPNDSQSARTSDRDDEEDEDDRDDEEDEDDRDGEEDEDGRDTEDDSNADSGAVAGSDTAAPAPNDVSPQPPAMPDAASDGDSMPANRPAQDPSATPSEMPAQAAGPGQNPAGPQPPATPSGPAAPATATPAPSYPPPSFGIVSASGTTSATQSGSYEPELVLDGDPGTAWNVPAAANAWITLTSGTGQYVSGIRILNGFTKFSPGYDMWVYYGNHRPKDITISFSDGTSVLWTLDDVFDEDNYIYQDIPLRAPVLTTYITITINSVYSGNKWNDICISEIEVY